jgi:hypothetical protein
MHSVDEKKRNTFFIYNDKTKGKKGDAKLGVKKP